MKEITERKKETMILWKDIFAKIPERQTKWNMFLPLFSFSSVRGGPGEKKKAQDEKEEQKGEKPPQQEQSNEIHAKKQEIKEDQIRTT